MSGKRTNFIDWDKYFMETALLAAQRSKDPKTQVGACIVNQENRIVAIGYNGMPNGCSDDELPWLDDKENPLESKHLYVCHAELNAIMNKNTADLKNCKMYVTLFPCNKCTQLILQSGIKEVIYLTDKHAHRIETKASKRMLTIANVPYRQYN